MRGGSWWKFRIVCAAFAVAQVVCAQEALTIDKTKLTVRTKALEVQFDRAGIVSIQNRLTSEQYVQKPGGMWFDFLRTRPIAGPVTTGEWVAGEEDDGTKNATIVVDSAGSILGLTVRVDANGEIAMRMSAEAPEKGVISATFGIFGLALSEQKRMIIPGQTGTYFDVKTQPEIVGLDYPTHWEHQMVIYEGGKGSLLLYSPDKKPHYQRLYASRQTGALDLAIEMFATAPFDETDRVETREWRLAAFEGDWKPAAARYKEVMREVFQPVPATGKRAWIKDVRGVVVFLNSEIPLLERVAKEVIPAQTLIHYVDWRNHPFDFYYPDYEPSERSKGFVKRAKELGFRVMLHANVLGISEVHPEYRNFAEYQLKRGDNRREIGWLWDEFGKDHPRRVAYISPAHAGYRNLFVKSIANAIATLEPDAMHLDAGGALVNDGNGTIEGMNSMEGMIELHKDLLRAYPDMVWGGESSNEIIGAYNWLAQRWASNYPPHPVVNYLMGDQTKFYGFLDQPSPDEYHYVDYLRRYEGQGVLPVAVLVNPGDLGPDRKRTFDLLRQFRRWQEKKYTPDFSKDWQGEFFRFRASEGQGEAIMENSPNVIQLREDGEIIYQRVKNANRYETGYFVEGWPAYDEKNLLGLDPEFEYWLTTSETRPERQLHLNRLPPNYKIGTGTYVGQRFGYFELEKVQRDWFDFISSFATAKTGTLYNGRDFPVINGAFLTITRVLMNGELRSGVLVAVPPTRNNVNGAAFVEYEIDVPMAPVAKLHFEAGIADSDGKSDGVLFGVQINGATLWRAVLQPGKWEPVEIDLAQHAGKKITVRFLTNAGENQNPRYDLASWSNIRLEVQLDRETAPIGFGVPAGTRIRHISDGVKAGAPENGTIPAETKLPNRFAVFLAEPPAIRIGESLLDLPYEVIRSTRDGLPYAFSVEGSGNMEPARSGGVTKARTLVAIPPRNGQTSILSAATIAEDAHSLTIEYGLIDPPSNFGADFEYSGVQFSVLVNGKELFSQEVRSAGWRSRTIPLEEYRGKPVLIQMQVNANQNALYDWARWTNLTVQ